MPNALEGMAAFPMANGNVRLIRNHEVREGAATSVPLGVRPYDARASAGCTSLEVAVHPVTGEPTVVDEFVSISGTIVNCAGGPTPWGSWLTCEEATDSASPTGRQRKHGYVGDLKRGGKLQMLVVEGRPQLGTSGGGVPPLVPLPAVWVDIDDPDPATLGTATRVFTQGRNKGGASFGRLEGAWWGDDSCYFVSTSGGAAGAGQVWQYRALSAARGQLTLVFESPGASVLDAPDNICVSPRGGIVLCEDGGAGNGQYLRGLTRTGQIFDLVRTNSSLDSEFAGACFSPDGRILFFNQQGSTARVGGEPGATFALWGPWEQGAL